METNSTYQEILLLTGTAFAARQYSEKDDFGNPNPLSAASQLQAACWNGSLSALLPEIVETSAPGKQLFLWQVYETHSFLELELGEDQEEKDRYLSIDPYAFMSTEIFN
jgi:hypothetical protein